MVSVLGGPADLLAAPDRHLPAAPVVLPVKAAAGGYVQTIDCRRLGLTVVSLGGGRHRPEDDIDGRRNDRVGGAGPADGSRAADRDRSCPQPRSRALRPSRCWRRTRSRTGGHVAAERVSGPAARRLAIMNQQELIQEAAAARQKAYAPYSHFLVGAAVLTQMAGYSTAAMSRMRRTDCAIAQRTALFQARSRQAASLASLRRWP